MYEDFRTDSASVCEIQLRKLSGEPVAVGQALAVEEIDNGCLDSIQHASVQEAGSPSAVRSKRSMRCLLIPGVRSIAFLFQ